MRVTLPTHHVLWAGCLLILLNLSIGFLAAGINNVAHIGGLIGGILITKAVGVKYKSSKIDIINGSPLISITVYPEGTIRSSGSIFNYIDTKNITSLEKAATNYLEKILKDYLYTISKKYNWKIWRYYIWNLYRNRWGVCL